MFFKTLTPSFSSDDCIPLIHGYFSNSSGVALLEGSITSNDLIMFLASNDMVSHAGEGKS